jgi:hypothetical protein
VRYVSSLHAAVGAAGLVRCGAGGAGQRDRCAGGSRASRRAICRGGAVRGRGR